MDEAHYMRWTLQVGRNFSDVEDVIKMTSMGFVDHDHRILVEYALEVNLIGEKLSRRGLNITDIRQAGVILEKYSVFAAEHFRREEAYMRDHRLPGYARHREQHRFFLKFMENSCEDYRKGQLAIGTKLTLNMLEWLVYHINMVDYNLFVHGKG